MRVGVDGHEVYCYTGTRPVDPVRPTVVFVHGAANDHSVFALQSRYLAHHGRNVLAVDLPGHGRSGGPPLDGVEKIADWIARLLDAAGVRDAGLVGHSLGALAVLEAASRFPSRVSRIALLGPAFPMTVSDALLAAARADDHVAFELIAGWSHSVGKQLGGNPVPGMWMMGGALRLMERCRPGALYLDLRACHAYANGLAAAAAVRCPALLVLGGRDLMAPPTAAQGLIAALAERQVVTLPECGHAMMSEQPDAVLDALAAFL
jgi:pimeloyl-ACP methyl ester carboxylesterase